MGLVAVMHAIDYFQPHPRTIPYQRKFVGSPPPPSRKEEECLVDSAF